MDPLQEQKSQSMCAIIKDADKSKRFIMLSFCLSTFLVWCIYSILGSFFPLEAKSKDVASSTIGLILGIFELVIVIMAPIFGYFINFFGAKILYIGGIFLCGSASIVFGTLNSIQNSNTFVGICFFIRILAATGAASFTTSGYAILASHFPENLATVFSYLDIFIGLGLMIGPPLGGSLYEVGGFFLPLAIIGTSLVIFGIICIYFIPRQEIPKLKKDNLDLRLLKHPVVIIIILCQISGAICVGFTNATLSLFLFKTFNLTPIYIGLVFLMAPLSYCFMCPLWGFLADKNKRYTLHFISIGYFFGGLFYFLIGPAPFFNFPPKIWLIILSLTFGGFGISVITLSFKVVSDSCTDIGYPQDIGTYGLVATVVISSFAIGAFIGPFLGGYLYDKIGFESTSCIVGACAISCSALIISYLLVRHFCNCCQPKSEEKAYLLENCPPSSEINSQSPIPNENLLNEDDLTKK